MCLIIWTAALVIVSSIIIILGISLPCSQGYLVSTFKTVTLCIGVIGFIYGLKCFYIEIKEYIHLINNY